MVDAGRNEYNNTSRGLIEKSSKRTPDEAGREGTKSNAATGASAAGGRAVAVQMMAFYFRAPAKAFFRTRVDYLAFARTINPRVQANEAWSWRMSSPALIGHAIRTHGWGFVPNHVLPPLLANVGVGAALYTSYLQILGSLYRPSSEPVKRVYPPPPIYHAFFAGFAAGAIQSVIATPLDALQVRFKTSDILGGRYRTMWQYGAHKLREIGLRGAYAGLSLSFVKDSLGFGVFFATFEYVKAQSFYAFVTRFYGGLQLHAIETSNRRGPDGAYGIKTIKPHYAMEPIFLLLAGFSATVFQQLIQHPLTLIQEIHYGRLEAVARLLRSYRSRPETFRPYRRAYERTFQVCKSQARQAGSIRLWVYKGFVMTTLKQVPSTSAGLVIFELVRRRYGNDSEAVRIEKDGYDIMLS